MRYEHEYSFDEYRIIDTENENKVVALCDNHDDAMLVMGAMNFYNKPGEFGYKMVIEE